ncbi:MAG: CapA family protein [Treponema sp.]|nr:CapA family protein [Treponema sp.]
MHMIQNIKDNVYVKKFMQKDARLKAVMLSVAACAAALLLVLVLRAFRPVRYCVRICDELYEQYEASIEEANALKKRAFVFVRETDSAAVQFFGAIHVTAARIFIKTELPLVASARYANETYYALAAKAILPTVKADFENEGAKTNSVLSPDVSVSFADAYSIPEGSRALPVEGVYAGEDGYALYQTTYAVCAVYVEKVADDVRTWCEAAFGERIAKADDALFSDGKVLANDVLAQSDVTVQSNARIRRHAPVFVASVGDIMVARGVEDILIQQKDGLAKVFGTTLPVLQKNDITIGNLEGVVTDSWSNATKTYTFKFKEAVLPFLKQAGFTYLMQANNHCYDYGEAGFKDTLAALRKYDIPTSGAGRNADEAKQFYHTTVGDTTFAIISCGAYPVERSGFNGRTTATATETRAGILWQSDELLMSIAQEKAMNNFVIVNVHGGEEYRFAPTKAQRELYESFCDAGADVVFGSHPHVLQPIVWRGKSLIVYSLGNFLFNGMDEMPGATDSMIVRLGILDGKIAYVEKYNAVLNGTSVALK